MKGLMYVPGHARRFDAAPATSGPPPMNGHRETIRLVRYVPKNEPAYAGARCARGGVRGNDGGSG
jgi:hypothetical protein